MNPRNGHWASHNMLSGRVWREDGVEFLINRFSDTTKEQRCQIILNTKGNIN